MCILCNMCKIEELFADIVFATVADAGSSVFF